MKKLKEELLNEIPYLREQSQKFLDGEISKTEYKSVSGGFGVYAQRDQKSFMVRLRISSGAMSLPQLKAIQELAHRCNLKEIHLTTRQAIQFHDLNIDQLCMVIKEGLAKDIFTRGGGGNFPRNVAASPLSGFSLHDAFDVMPYAVAVDQYFIRNMTSYHLPRKLKVSFSSSFEDHAHCTVQDLGFMAVLENGQKRFRVFLGGGLGNNPKKALQLEDLISPDDIIYYVNAMITTFKTYGNYENKHKARVRYMIDTLGEDVFIEKFLEFVQAEKSAQTPPLIIQECSCQKPGIHTALSDSLIILQRQEGLYGIEIHPYGGKLLLDDLDRLVDELDNLTTPVIRLAMTEGLFILNLDGTELESILKISRSISGNTNIEKSVSCIGTPICQMGIQNTQEMLLEIIDYFKAQNASDALLNVLPQLHISGCQNSCGVHQIGAIGLAGKVKRLDGKPTDIFSLFLGGRCEYDTTRLGTLIGDFKRSDLPHLIYQLALNIHNVHEDFYNILESDPAMITDLLEEYRI